MDNYTLSDVAAVTRDNDGMFGGGGMWIFALLVLCLLGNGGGFFGENGNAERAATVGDVQRATDFQALERQNNEGVAATRQGVYDVTGAIKDGNYNGFEFTNRFSNSKRDLPSLFEQTAAELGIRHKLIRPYTPRHNGKVERSHREDQKRFYSCHAFYSLVDFAKQLAVHNRRSNNLPMRPLHWLSPAEFTVQYV